MKYKNRFIEKSKIAVDELINVLASEIDLATTGSNSKVKKALEVKKHAFVQAKQIITGVLEHDQKQQEWAKHSIEQLIIAGSGSVESLIDSLSEPVHIEVIGNNADDVDNAIKSKGVAFNDVMELMSLIEELERIAKEDEIILKDIQFNEGYAEIYADKYNEKENKSGYDPKIDAVIIDPDGSVGDIIEISGLRIALPKKPKRSDIANHNRKKADQYWRRQGPPRALTPKSAKSYSDFIDQEYKYKRRGFWFYNNGNLEYITGPHWFHMTHCRTGADGGYYYFTKAQQKLFIFMEAVWCDQRCAGLILEKIRRLGATDMFMSFSLCKSISERDKIFGMTSKKDSDAKKNFRRQTHMFANLPFYFKPICKDEKSATILDFSSPSQRLTKKNQDKDKVDCSLNTYCNFESTSEDSYDGDALRLYLADEFSKWKKQNGNTLAHFEMVRKSATKGARITGKLFLFSTFENVTGRDAEDEDALAGDRYKQIYMDSDPTQRNANGQTRSYLYKIFLSVYEHYEGFIDRYGYAILEDPKEPVKTMDGDYREIGIRTYIQRELDHIGDNLRARTEYLRKTPIKEEHGYAVAEGMCLFNQGNILSQLAYNDSMPKSPNGDNTKLRRGNFEWKDGRKDCGKVIWKDNPNGRFLIGWMPPEDLQNNIVKRGRFLMPGNSDIGALGIDPYRTDKSKDGSKGSIHGKTKVNPKAPSEFFFLEYVHRPDQKSIFQEDAIMAMVFFGMPALIESNVRSLLEEMHKRGYRKFSLNRPDKTKDKLTHDEKKYGGMPSSSEDVLQMQESAIETYVENFVGELDGDGYGNMLFNKTLLDWLSYDRKNRTKRDASISSSLAIIACNSKARKAVDKSVQTEVVSSFIRRYNNRGTVGKRM